jgi:Ca2+/Na+ antiporter
MKLSNLFIFNAIAALVYGISSVIVPTTVLSLHGMTQGQTEALVGQFFGVSLIAIGLVTWFARNVTDKEAQRAIMTGLLISDVIGFIVVLLGMLSNLMNALGWVAAGLYLLLALGYGYFRFLKPQVS